MLNKGKPRMAHEEYVSEIECDPFKTMHILKIDRGATCPFWGVLCCWWHICAVRSRKAMQDANKDPTAAVSTFRASAC